MKGFIFTVINVNMHLYIYMYMLENMYLYLLISAFFHSHASHRYQGNKFNNVELKLANFRLKLKPTVYEDILFFAQNCKKFRIYKSNLISIL